MTHLITRTVAETRAVGRALGAAAFPGAVVALVGELGAGKTALAQGFGEGLDVGGPVVSPTFVVLQRHDDGRLPLFHVDLYRVDDPAELDQIGLDEALDDGGVALVEWADKHPGRLPDDHLRVELRHAAEGARTLDLVATGPRHAAWLAALDG